MLEPPATPPVFVTSAPPLTSFSRGQAYHGTKVAAGICGILLGGFGVHKFVLGYVGTGLLMMLLSFVGAVMAICTLGLALPLPVAIWVIGIIEGAMYLSKSDEEFYLTYVVNSRLWF